MIWMLKAAGSSGWGRGLLTNDRPVGVACVPSGWGVEVEGVHVTRGYSELKETQIYNYTV